MSVNSNETSKGDRLKCIDNKANTQFIFKRVIQIDNSGVKVKILWEGRKIWKNLPPVLTKLNSVKTSGRLFQIFVVVSEKLHFNEHCIHSWYIPRTGTIKELRMQIFMFIQKMKLDIAFFFLQHVFFFRFLHLMPNPRMTLSW